MNIIGVIPARYNSTRLPFKLLRNIFDKPLIQWTWENASRARSLDRLIVACDDQRIEEVVRGFGGDVVMTSARHLSGTDRIAEAVNHLDVDVIINIQADEPVVHPSVIDALAQAMRNDSDLVMATVRKKVDDEREINDSNVVKVICDKDGFALYFSRFSLPYYRQADTQKLYYKHLGVYAYTKDFLYTYRKLPVSYLENAEKLEQLRVLEAGYKIKVIETKFESCGVDTEDDLITLEKILGEKKNA